MTAARTFLKILFPVIVIISGNFSKWFVTETAYQRSKNKICMKGVDVWRENLKLIVRSSRPSRNLKFDHFTPRCQDDI